LPGALDEEFHRGEGGCRRAAFMIIGGIGDPTQGENVFTLNVEPDPRCDQDFELGRGLEEVGEDF